MLSPTTMEDWSKKLLSADLQEKLDHLLFQDAGHGYDTFGMHPSAIRFGVGLFSWIYEEYFRVVSVGAENIPTTGSAILAPNHSGNIPIDAMMLWNDVLRHTSPPRVPRGIADHFVPALPFIGTLFARGGMVGGSSGNVRSLLSKGELLMIFPEGVPGIVKPWRNKYQLQKFRVGHAQLAILHSCPIVPVAIIGAEEQLPSFFASKTIGKIVGIDAVPIPITPVPLPVRYRIYYGKPIPVHEEYQPADSDNPTILKKVSQQVKEQVQVLLDRGLSERKGVFR